MRRSGMYTIVIFFVILMLSMGNGGKKSSSKDSTINATGSVFKFYDKKYDISKRAPDVSSIGLKNVADYIIVEGYTGGTERYFGIYNTQTKDFEKDILGSNLTYHSGDIKTAVYSYQGDIYNYKGAMIFDLSLSDEETIIDIYFIDDNKGINVVIESLSHVYSKKLMFSN